MTDNPIVVIGAGQAGLQLIATLRTAKYPGPIALVGDESHLPYQRPPLAKDFLAGNTKEEDLYLRKESYYSVPPLTLHLGQRVEAIDRTARETHLTSGAIIPYSTVVIATGARARRIYIPGAELNGVVSLRTFSDARLLRRHLREPKNVVILGGGFIGLEVAAIARSQGHTVTVVEAQHRPLTRSVAEELANHLTKVHSDHDVRFRLQANVIALHGSVDSVKAVEFSDGSTIPADVVLVGVGATPNSEIAETSGLPVDGGIIVDGQLRTTDPNISAIGDCAVFPSEHAGGRLVRLESVQNAVDQARFVARRLAGGDGGGYRDVPWFWTHQYDQMVQMVGLASASDDTVVVGSVDSGRFSVARFVDDVLTSVESVNRPDDHMAARRLLGSPTATSRGELEAVGFDLATAATMKTSLLA
ncbi:NAD(P)/FAD-dependent oxidoreductase [Nocardia vaccinii]|uniref:NAD(P)/FAD-dependent oxidoreductase n=1 Tax=Nocardia vaccinii TaxID=1822 RepID=UPI00082ACCF0|nr:FAD-dependent oxidoreductase [Nocardia vaccinii]